MKNDNTSVFQVNEEEQYYELMTVSLKKRIYKICDLNNIDKIKQSQTPLWIVIIVTIHQCDKFKLILQK